METIDRTKAVTLIEESLFGEFRHDEKCHRKGKKLYSGCDITFGYFEQCNTCGKDRYCTNFFDPKMASVAINKLDLEPMSGGGKGANAAVFIAEKGFTAMIFDGNQAKATGFHETDMGIAMVNAILNQLFPDQYKVEK